MVARIGIGFATTNAKTLTIPGENMNQIERQEVGSYMSTKVTVVSETAPLNDAIFLMETNELTLLPVVDSNSRLVGVLSVYDVSRNLNQAVKQSNGQFLPQATYEDCSKWIYETSQDAIVKDYMTVSPVTASTDMSIVQAAQILIDNACHRLPVIDPSHRIIGIFSTYDLTRAVAGSGSPTGKS